MIIFTGIEHARKNPDSSICMTNTSLKRPGFVIKEFDILVNNVYAFDTPWLTPRDHYVNLLKHNGRYDNKSIGEGVDYFQFIEENWFVPMSFADRVGKDATVEVRIVFEEALTGAVQQSQAGQTAAGDKRCSMNSGGDANSWDAMWLHIPIDSLMLDRNKKSKCLSNFAF